MSEDSSDYIGELEACPRCKGTGGKLVAKDATSETREECWVCDGTGRYFSADERAAWADHFRAMGWAPPEEVEELRHESSPKAVIGHYKIASDSSKEGTIIGHTHWHKLVEEAGLTDQWLELSFRPVQPQGLEGRDWSMLEAAQDSLREHSYIISDKDAEIERLRGENEELRRDAERYKSKWADMTDRARLYMRCDENWDVRNSMRVLVERFGCHEGSQQEQGD